MGHVVCISEDSMAVLSTVSLQNFCELPRFVHLEHRASGGPVLSLSCHFLPPELPVGQLP